MTKQNKNIKEDFFKSEAYEYFECHFPKGDNRRGEVMCLLALTLQFIENMLVKENE